ncbi:MAG TPA: glycosyltransferase family 39 protein [Ktedonobacteraceae bacterium]
MTVSTIKNDTTGNGTSSAGNPRWQNLLMWGLVIVLVIVAIIMRLYKLDVPFDRDGYDEGVYWQSLRAMGAGHALYRDIFYSQPPFFLLSTFPGYLLFGSTLWAARLGIALVSLFGLAGAFLLGKATSGRLGAVIALVLLIANPVYLSQSQIIQAEVSSTAFSLLAVGLAYTWWEQPEGIAGLCWAMLTGIAVTLGILCKLLSVSCLVPVVLLMLARTWQSWQQRKGAKSILLPILAGTGACIVTALLILLPFLNSYSNMVSTVITFHTQAGATFASSQRGNFSLIKQALISWLSLAALFGIAAAVLRRDWRVIPLIAWLLVTIYLLWRQVPLFQHHLIALVPPLIGLAIMGIGTSVTWKSLARFKPIAAGSTDRITEIKNRAGFTSISFQNIMAWIALMLILITVVLAVRQDRQYYRNIASIAADQETQQELHVAADLNHAIARGQLVITDAQFIAGLADRNTPPSLVDTSTVRIVSGYLTLAQLENAASQPQVHAVLFYTGRLGAPETAPFHTWVAQRFRLLHNYGGGRELWVR